MIIMAYEKIASHEEYLKKAEQYQEYEAGAYHSMTLQEKMDFFDGVHTDNVPLWDEDGDEMDTLEDYNSIRDEFLSHPEQFSQTDIRSFMEMLDDSCGQPSFMDTVTKIIHSIARFYQLEGVAYLLSHLQDAPERGRMFGWFVTMRLIIHDDASYAWTKEALKELPPSALRLILNILSGKDMPKVCGGNGRTSEFPLFDACGNETERARKDELEHIVSGLFG